MLPRGLPPQPYATRGLPPQPYATEGFKEGPQSGPYYREPLGRPMKRIPIWVESQTGSPIVFFNDFYACTFEFPRLGRYIQTQKSS